MSGGFGTDPVPGEVVSPQAPVPESMPVPSKIGLQVRNGPGSGRTFPVPAPKALVGRSDPPAVSADIDLTECERGPTPVISRRHAEIEWRDGAPTIADLGSTNGTWVNGERLPARGLEGTSAPIAIRPGDRIVLADLEFEVVAED